MVGRLLLPMALVGTLVGTTPASAACTNLLSMVPRASLSRDVTALDLVRLRDVGELEPAIVTAPSPLALSPDGRSLAFLVRRGDPAQNTTCQAMVVLDLKTRIPRVIDAGDHAVFGIEDLRGSLVRSGYPATIIPDWSRDGGSVLFLKSVNGSTQLWRARSDGHGSVPVTRSATDVMHWGFDQQRDRVLVETRPGIAVAERAADREMLSGVLYDGRIDPGDGVRPQPPASIPTAISSISLQTGEARPATTAELAWFAGLPRHGVPTQPLALVAGWRASAPTEAPSPLAPRRIVVVDPLGRALSCRAAACADKIDQLWWERPGSLVFLRREGWRQGQMALYRWQPGNRLPVRLLESPYWLSGCQLGKGRLLCVGENATTPKRIVAVDLARRRLDTVFDLNPEFASLRLGTVRRLTWRNDRGLPAWGDLVLPPGYRPGDKLPLVVTQYHSVGFLRGGTSDEYPIFPLAAHGIAVLSTERPPHVSASMPGIRTSDDINAAGRHNWAERRSLFSSIEAGIDQAIAVGVADPKRIGITGLSDGSTTLEWGLINSHRFAAAATSTCCTDLNSVMTYGGTDWADWNHAVMGYPLASDHDLAFWRPQSIAVSSNRIDTPLLMQLADREYLLALEGFTALRERRRPVELLIFPNEYHYKTQPAHRWAIYERNIDWFGYWLQGRRDRDPAKADQYRRWDRLRSLRDAARLAIPSSSPSLRPRP